MNRVELAFEAVSVKARQQYLLEDVTLSMGAGDFVALVGPNGAGKSTLLRLAVKLLRPSSGQVMLDGKLLDHTSARWRAARLSWLPQAPRMDEALSARELVAAARYRFTEARATSLHEADRALERVGAAAFFHRNVLELSGGERQRVALAALIAQQTPLLMLDEPANHLDPAQQIQIYELLGSLWREGYGVLCVTHDINLLAHIDGPRAPRVAGLSRGRLAFQLDHTDSALHVALGELFGLELVALEAGGRRVLIPTRSEAGERP